MENVIITQTHKVDNVKGAFKIALPYNVDFKDYEVALGSINIYYSWYNISSTFGNNTFTYTYPNGGGTNTYNITLPNGNYSVADLNSFLEFKSIENKTYLIDDTGKNVYYINIQVNPLVYAIQVNATPVPLALPVGWTAPIGAPVLPTSINFQMPQLVINNAEFGKYLGYALGSYPATPVGNTLQSFIGTVPSVNTVSSVLMKSNLCFNKLSNVNSVLVAFTPQNVSFGNNLYISPNEFIWIDCQQGAKQSIDINFTDQLNRPLELLDTDICVNLLIRKKK